MSGNALVQRWPRRWPAIGLLARIERLIPANRISRTHDHQHARLFVLSHVFGPVIGLSLCAFLVAWGFPADGRLFGFALLVCLFWAYPPALRAHADYRLLSLVSLEHLVLVILWASFAYGGAHSPFLLWLVIVPLLAFLYLAPNPRLWAGLLAMLALNLGGFVLALNLLPPPPLTGPHALAALGLLSTLSASAYVAMMASYFGHVLASRADLEQEIAQHSSTAAALADAAAEVRRAGEAKADFVARMSHELRAPLNAVIGYGQLLLEDAHASRDRAVIGDLESITGAGQYLITLVDDVLEYSRIDAGAVVVQPEPIKLSGLLATIGERLRPLAEQRRNDLAIATADAAGTIRSDRALLERAIFCVGRHCSQSTIAGHVKIAAVRLDDGGVAIEISDDGQPIPPARLATLFDPLDVQSDAGTTKYGGHGLGLALAQRICRLLGGEIQLVSEKGEGSRFSILLPLTHA